LTYPRSIRTWRWEKRKKWLPGASPCLMREALSLTSP
jgi:hypothetical protein